jgi:DNA-binding response OmpR family regulator
MVYTPAMDGSEALAPVVSELQSELDDASLLAPLVRRGPTAGAVLRFGGLVLHTATGSLTWRGRALTLSTGERELLHILLCHAGQIVSGERLAAMLGLDLPTLTTRMTALKTSLKQAGSTTLPYAVNGLGYILWRC